MRIAMFTDTYEPQINGVVTSIRSFSDGLEKKGNDVHIFAPGSPNTSYPRNVHPFRSFPFLPYPGYRIGVPPLDILRRFSAIGFDIVHVHSPLSVGSAGAGIAKLEGKPLVGTFHTLLPEYLHYMGRMVAGSAGAKKAAWKYCVWFYNRCDLVTAPSEYIARLLVRNGIKRPVRVVPEGVKPPAKAVKRKAGRMLLHVGRLTREKNIEAVLRAFKEVRDAELAITSDGPHRKNLEEYAKKLGVSDRVKFTGFLSRGELERQYAAADAFVFASKSETQAIVILEALRHRLPIACLDDPVVGSFVRRYRVGIATTPSKLPQAIERILSDTSLRKEFSENSLKAVAEYSEAASIRKLLDAYEEAMRIRKAGS